MIPLFRSVLLFPLLFACLSGSSNVLAGSAELYSELKSKNFLTHIYDDFLKRFFELAKQRGDLSAPVQIGGGYQPNRLNVYTIRADDRFNKEHLQSIDYPYMAATRAFLAVHRNTILVGEAMLAEIMLTIYNDLLAGLQAGDLPGSDRKQQVTLASALAAFQRIGNLSNTTHRFNPDDLAINIAPKLLAAERFTGINAPEYFYHGLLFIFAHEIAHLDKGFGGAFFGIEDFRDWIIEFRKSRARKEEHRADAVARKVIVRALTRDNNINNVLSVYAVIGYLRDRINLVLFEEFRGTAADNRLVSFRYRRCEPTVARLRNYREDNIDLVDSGFWNVLPILGKFEYKAIQDYLSRDRVVAVHEHNFLRSKQILEDLEVAGLGPKWFVPIKPFLRFYEAILQGLPYLQQEHISGVTSLSAGDFLLLLTPQPMLEDSSACEKGLHCQTGRFGDSFVELMLYNSRVKYAVIYAPFLEPGDLKEARSSTYGSSQADGILRKMASHTLFSGQWPQDVTSKRIVESLASCGVYSHVIRFDTGTAEVTALKGGRFLRFLIYPSEHDILVPK